MCEGCNVREAVIQAALWYCGQIMKKSGEGFAKITSNLNQASSEALSELIRLRARHELAKEILEAIQGETKKWEIVLDG